MKLTLLTIFSFLCFSISAQLNVELLSNVTYDSEGSDVWGYAAPDGSEYAIFGVFNGVSVVNVTDPRNPVEVDFIEQQGSIWRDIKTWGEFAYVTSDQPGTRDGLLVIDMSNLPDSISYVNMNTVIPNVGTINTCHNIYIDEFGFAYLAGCNVNGGGMIILDVNTNPGDPIVSAVAPNEYSHDVYVRNEKMYSAEINIGVFSVYDVSDKSNISLLASQSTPFEFTHNLWLSDDGNIIFTTDEVANAPVASYDITDLNNIQLLDEFRPSATLGDGVIPHNVHVWEDWLIISYYSDGCIIVDAARPDNLIEVGNFDTFIPNQQGFNGAWGAYPFLPSGTILIGDINNGLFILGPTYVRAAYLEGNVTDAQTGLGINNASIIVEELDLTELSKADGGYKTGTHTAGTYTVTASAFGYLSQSKEVEMNNGDVAMADFELDPLPSVTINGEVVDAITKEPIANSKVKISNEGFEEEIESDTDGKFSLPSILIGEYDLIAGQWGYKYTCLENYTIEGAGGSQEITIELESGYEDIFSIDLGWTVEFIGGSGIWERADPIGQSPSQNAFIAPEDDSDDKGVEAYVTGNAETFFSGLLFGDTKLISPAFDVSTMGKATLSYQTYFWNSDFNGNPADEEMYVTLSNGIDTVVIDTIVVDFNTNPFQWFPSGEITIADYIEPTENMTISVNIAEVGGDSALEGGFDDFKVYDAASTAIAEIQEYIVIEAFPNPSANEFHMNIPEAFKNGSYLMIYTVNGQLVDRIHASNKSEISFGKHLLKGMYLVQLVNKNEKSKVLSVIKM